MIGAGAAPAGGASDAESSLSLASSPPPSPSGHGAGAGLRGARASRPDELELGEEQYCESEPREHRRGLLEHLRLGKYRARGYWREQLHKRLPITLWGPAYRWSYVRADVVSGLTIGVLLVPQALSYSVLAGLAPQYGLYACLAAPLVYMATGTSVQLQVGPFALISLLTVSTVSKVVDPVREPGRYLEAVLATSVLCGCVLLAMGALRLGALVHFLSQPVISGLTTAGALLISASQLGYLLGFPIPRGSFWSTLVFAAGHLGQTNAAALAIGLGSYAALYGYRRFRATAFARRWRLASQPVALYVMLLATLLSHALALSARQGLKVLGELPRGIPAPHVPGGFSLALELMPAVLVISVVGYALSIATAKTFADKCQYDVDANQELLALGLANVAAGFFNGFPAFASLSRSGLAYESGAKTPLHNPVAVLLVVLVLTCLTEYLRALPYACLTAIIVDSLHSLFLQLAEPSRLWRADRRDLGVWLATFLAALTWDVDNGLYVGVGASIALLLWSSSFPSWASLGRFPKLPAVFKDLRRFPEAQPVPRVLVLRFDAALHFANADNVRRIVRKAVAERRRDDGERRLPPLRAVVIDAAAITDCDSTAAAVLVKVQRDLDKQGLELVVCCVRVRVRQAIHSSAAQVPEFGSVHAAVAYAEHAATGAADRADGAWAATVHADARARSATLAAGHEGQQHHPNKLNSGAATADGAQAATAPAASGTPSSAGSAQEALTWTAPHARSPVLHRRSFGGGAQVADAEPGAETDADAPSLSFRV
jgi:SulP family sulfate permease